jgi:RNA polymerase sigma factor (sigma-70 family)
MSTEPTVETTPRVSGVLGGLEALFDAEYEPMYRLAYAMLGSHDDSEEVVQEGFVGVASRWSTVHNPGAYLQVSVVNGARKRMRSRQRQIGAEASIRSATTDSVADSDDYLLDVLDRLGDRQRVVLVLTYYAGLDSTEVGNVLDCPPSTVRSLIRRALEQLRREVKP